MATFSDRFPKLSKFFKDITGSGESIRNKSAASVGKGQYTILGSWSFNGEKNLGELGPAKEYSIDYETLRVRSWQIFLESETAQTVLRKFNVWVVGKGLRLQSEPIEKILEDANIKIDIEAFSKSVEARFTAFAKSKSADYSGMRTLNQLEAEALKNKKVGGDYLTILRFKKGKLSVQMVDGCHIISPMAYGNEFFPRALENGNTIINGIELSPSGEHIAYYVRKPGYDQFSWETERILARGSKTGLLMAYMVYGSRYRLDNHRGMPLLSVVFETLKKLERYKEAVIGSAEERQKIAYFFEHGVGSTGENPLLAQTATARNGGMSDADLPTDSYGNDLANRVAATTNKQTFNLPIDTKLKAVEGKNELYFKDFYEVNIMIVCASVGIPYEVAMSKFETSYSSARAAIKDWENTLLVERDDEGNQFLQPIYEAFIWNEIFNGRISAPGYVKAWLSNDEYVLSAYHNCRWVGAPVPHIDPQKEVESVRMKLGQLGAAMPLITLEDAIEELNSGDSDAVVSQFARELKQTIAAGIKMIEPDKTPAQKDKVKKPSGT
jgi:capsid protein